VAVWVGATAGEVLAASIGAFFGSRVGARLNPKAVKLASAALFALFGVLLLVSA
jgi:putative Ca2+/H+ antiporter (TMEM165/GDT1 family)